MIQFKKIRAFALAAAVCLGGLSSSACAHDVPIPHAHPHGMEWFALVSMGVVAALAPLIARFGKRRFRAQTRAVYAR